MELVIGEKETKGEITLSFAIQFEKTNGKYVFAHIADLPGFVFTCEPTEISNIKVLMETMTPILCAYLETHMRKYLFSLFTSAVRVQVKDIIGPVIPFYLIGTLPWKEYNSFYIVVRFVCD